MSRRTLLAGAAAVAVGASATARLVTSKKRTTSTKAAPRTTLPRSGAPWWSDRSAGRSRQLFAVSAAGFARSDHPVEVDLAAGSAPIAAASVRVVEVDAAGMVIDTDVAHQYDRGVVPSLVFLLKGKTAPEATRRYAVYFDIGTTAIPAKAVPSLVNVDEHHADEGQDGFLVSTRAGAYSYQRKGASFSSLVDRDGNDWLSYHPEPGAGPMGANGPYRGMPNFHFPDGNFHPGFEVSESEVVARGPLRAIIRSTSGAGGTWAYETAFFPDFVRSTVTKAASDYWFLYEGTPGGESARGGIKPFKVMRSDGGEYGHRDDWSKALKGESWVSFRSPGLGGDYGRSFYLVHHDPDSNPDSYYLARNDGAGVTADDIGSMTVFGFGRFGAKMTMSPDQSPNRFTFALMEPTDVDDAARVLRGAYKDLAVASSTLETSPRA